MDEIVGFAELRWLRELTVTTRKQAIPELIGARLLKRKLVERTIGGFALTTRGRIALHKLG
ncbi:MAG TPA: hypothetical protein VGA12_06705 [Burkholderiales bacterium]|jgi:hypothetical protein